MDNLELPPLDRQVSDNTHRSIDNAIGWKISTCIAIVALVYSIMYNNHQDTILEKAHYVTIEEAQCLLYEHLTGLKDPMYDCNRTKVVTP